MGHRQFHQRTTPERLTQTHPGQATDPQTRFHCPLDGFGVLQLQGQIQLRYQTMQAALKRLPGARAGFPDNPVSLPQVLVCECFLTGKSMLRATKHHQLILSPGQQLQVRVVQFALNQPQIQLERQHPLHDSPRVGHLQVYPGAGLLRHIIGHDPHRQIIADGQRGPHIQTAQISVTEQVGLQLPGLGQQRLCPRPELAAQLIEFESLAGPFEELQVVEGLQLLEGTGSGGLAHAQALCRLADVLVVRRGQEDLKLTQGKFHGHSLR